VTQYGLYCARARFFDPCAGKRKTKNPFLFRDQIIRGGAQKPKKAMENSEFGLRQICRVLGLILALAVFLFVLRLCCNLSIDVCLMRDMDAARRTLIEFRDRYFPFFKRRLVLPHHQDSDVEAQEDQSSASEISTLDALLTGLTLQERRQVLDAVLPRKVSSANHVVHTQKDGIYGESCRMANKGGRRENQS